MPIKNWLRCNIISKQIDLNRLIYHPVKSYLFFTGFSFVNIFKLSLFLSK